MKFESGWMRTGAGVAALVLAACAREDAYQDDGGYDTTAAQRETVTDPMPRTGTAEGSVPMGTPREASAPRTPPQSAGAGQQGTTGSQAQQGAQAVSLASFLDDAARSGTFEVRAAEVLLEKEVSEPLQELAEQIQDDHQEANAQLADIAEDLLITVPTELAPEQQRQLDELEGQSGVQLETTYLRQQVEAHEKAIALFEKAQALEEPRAAAFARETLPVLRKHLASLRDRQATAGGQQDGQDG